jgi:hypothetical protein
VRDDNATWLVVLHSFPFIPPCEPTLRDRLPKGEGWLYEAKFDGYRLLIHGQSQRHALHPQRANLIGTLAGTVRRDQLLSTGVQNAPVPQSDAALRTLQMVAQCPSRSPRAPSRVVLTAPPVLLLALLGGLN